MAAERKLLQTMHPSGQAKPGKTTGDVVVAGAIASVMVSARMVGGAVTLWPVSFGRGRVELLVIWRIRDSSRFLRENGARFSAMRE